VKGYAASVLEARPGGAFAHPELPTDRDDLMVALGAEPVAWNGKAKCCGSSMVMTHEGAALPLVDMLIGTALGAGASIVSAACSVCQMNLDAYQSRVRTDHRRNFHLPVVYFTQLMGLAFGITPGQLGLARAFVPALEVLQPYL
jgi:heterodisulfide reductase subunit B2